MPDSSPIKATVTPYAENLIAAAESRAVDSKWIGTAEAARKTGYSQRRIAALCDEGFFVAGVDWRQRAPKPGLRHGGRKWIRRAALSRLDGGSAEGAS